MSISMKVSKPLYRSVSNYYNGTAISVTSVRSFDEIPGPIRLPIFGSIYLYKLGIYNILEYHKVLCQLNEKYGPVVKERIGNRTVVHVFDPDDIKTVFSVEGKMPTIPPLQETTQLYRKKKQLSLGLGNTNGEEWYKLRSAVHKMMLRPKEVHHYLPMVDVVAQDFIRKIERSLDSYKIAPDLRDLVAKWSLESSGMVCFEKRLGSFDNNEDLAEKMIAANKDIFTIGGLLKFSLPLFNYIPTPKWLKFLKAEDFFYSNATRLVEETLHEVTRLSEKNELKDQYNFLSYLLSRKELTPKDVFIITLSLFGDGLSTTTPTLMFNLYCLAANPEVQERVAAEVIANIPPSSPITVNTLHSLQLLKASVKEVFRMYPNGTEVSRILQSEVVLGNYLIPPGTHVDMNHLVNFRSTKYFSTPEKFIPERWLRDDENPMAKHPFLLTPFGHGTRMCAGRRFAEQDLYTVISRILQKFRLELVNPDDRMDLVYNTLLFPKNPLKLKFISR